MVQSIEFRGIFRYLCNMPLQHIGHNTTVTQKEISKRKYFLTSDRNLTATALVY